MLPGVTGLLDELARHDHPMVGLLTGNLRDGAVVLSVRDDGRGITEREAAARRMGLGGMHERALLIGGELTVRPCQHGGTEVRLAVPVRETG